MRELPQRMLVGVRGKTEALAAVRGGVHIVDVEYPAASLGTPYPLNILAVRESVPLDIPIATNIGGEQLGRSTACQAALGVALAGADIIKLGLAKMPVGEATEFGPALIRTVKKWFPGKRCVPVLFADERLARWYIDPISDGPELAAHMKADGLLVDTYDKGIGMGLLDYYKIRHIQDFVAKCHDKGLEAWVGGSITKDELPELWATDVDAVCVRGAACLPGTGPGRFGEISEEIVRELVATIPARDASYSDAVAPSDSFPLDIDAQDRPGRR
ncbi:MAG: (5-formylfuran-3-yl)methyl phosphate synthase [Phycisphaerales bacterium]